MSRLVPDDIKHIVNSVKEYDNYFRKQTGKSMSELSCITYNIPEKIYRYKAAVVPVTSGLGIISSFSESVCAILNNAGADAYVTDSSDVAGLQEAYLKKADIVFMADDDVCAAFSLKGKIQSDNGDATGKVFAAALCAAYNDESEILVLGAGPVGRSASDWLASHDKKVHIYDPVTEKSEKAANGKNILVLKEKPDLNKYKAVLDATPCGGWITESDVVENTVFSVPGMPLSLTAEATDKVFLIHNPLELGITAMYYDCVRQMEGKNNG